MKKIILISAVLLLFMACTKDEQIEPVVENNAGKAIYFNGTTNYIDIPNTAGVNTISEEFTFEAWIYPKVKSDITLFSIGENFFFHFKEYMRPAVYLEGLEIDFLGATNYAGQLLLNTSLPVLTWTHFACTYSSTDELLTIYVNGEVYFQCEASGLVQMTDDNIHIGGRFFDSPRYFRGRIDELRLWNYKRSQLEINNLMKSELVGNEAGLVAYWNFNELTGERTILDVTSNNNDGDIIGAVAVEDSYAF